MVKKVDKNVSFLTNYKKDIKKASNLLEKFQGDVELKGAMVDALLYCSETVSYDYEDEYDVDFLTPYLLKVESNFSESKRPLVWLCGYLSFELMKQNKNNFKPVIDIKGALLSDLSDLIGDDNYKSLFKHSKINLEIFFEDLINLIEKQLVEGWNFSNCLNQTIERNICLDIERRNFFCTDYDLSRENPGYIHKGNQFCFSITDLIDNINIYQYVKFKENSLLSKNALFYGKVVRMFASNLMEENPFLASEKSNEYYNYAKRCGFDLIEDEFFKQFMVDSFESNVREVLSLSNKEIVDKEYCDRGLLPVYDDFRDFHIDLDNGYYDE